MATFSYMIQPAREDMTPENTTTAEINLIGAHFEYLKQNYERGIVSYVGRTDSPPYIGVAVFEAEDLAAAEAFSQADPAIFGKVFVARIQPFKVIFS